MVEFIARKRLKDYENVKSTSVRMGYGVICGAIGIVLNLVMFVGKIIAGMLTGSIAIIADAINNLSDAGSSIIMVIGFTMSGKKPDAQHPFGHGRIEYVAGLIISVLIILMGVELIKSSITQIIAPTDVEYNQIALIVIIISIAIKLYMFYYNGKIAKKISSIAMKAVSRDSLTDAAGTAVVLVAMLASHFFGVHIDGIVGLLISAFIVYTGVTSAKDTIDPLLGSKPGKEYAQAIEKYVLSNEGILGMHDLMIHDYGPGRMMISFHAEVPATGDILELHDTIDNIERKLHSTLGCHTVVHMDPIITDDEITDRMHRLSELIVKSVDEQFTIHDFRMVKGPTHTNLIFDVMVPYGSQFTDEEIIDLISFKIEDLPGNHYAVLEIDHPMV